MHLPVELERIFAKHKSVKEFFGSLTLINQKEYVTWFKEQNDLIQDKDV
jgi:uncharacterized protein YdeI (YjbR/CyaY-like superfamily)